MITKSSNNILTIIFKDENRERVSLAFPSGRTKDEAFEQAMVFERFSKDDVQKYYFSADSEKDLNAFTHFDEEKEEIDIMQQSIAFKIDEIRNHRATLFSRLDFEFMKSMEEDCAECKEHLVLIKNYLRDLPFLAEQQLKTYTRHEDIIYFNSFNNIFKVMLADGGEGYEKPPIVTIDPPTGRKTGFQLEVSAGVKDGKVSELIITQYGSGYIEVPKIIIDNPDDINGKRAYAVAFLPENDIYTE